MQIVTINLPSLYVDGIRRLVDSGMFDSRSEAIRSALRDFLTEELNLVLGLANDSKQPAPEPEPKEAPRPRPVIDMRSNRAGWASMEVSP